MLNGSLSQFEPISLSEMDNVKLMDRMDSKYAFGADQLTSFLDGSNKSYRVLEISGHRTCRYESLYFDTPQFDLYHHHHTGNMNRYKIRYRRYVESNICFLEAKFKNNKGRTIKNRIKQNGISRELNQEATGFLQQHISNFKNNLEFKMWINFTRITLVNRNYPERVTIDLNLQFKNDTSEMVMNDLVIAEIKQDKAIRSEFVRLLKKHHVREGTLSKYCVGVTQLYPHEKRNNFKPILIQFKKLHHGIVTGNSQPVRF